MHKRLLCAVMVLGITLSISNVKVFAAPSLDEQLNAAQAQYNEGQNRLSSAQQKVRDLQNKIQDIDNQIQLGIDKVNALNNKIGDTENNIKISQEKIKRSEDNIKSEQRKYNETIRTMYINGNNSYLDALLQSKGLSDFISKMDNVRLVAKYNDKIITDLNSRKQDVEKKKNVLDEEKQKLTVLKEEQNQKNIVLNKQKEEQKPLIEQANAEVNSAQQFSVSANAQIASINNKVQAVKAAQSAAVTSSAVINRGGSIPKVTGGYSSDAIVTYAASFQGVPYVWGGTSPSGFDCSGFVQYVYAHFGISIPRVSQDQFNFGTSVSASDLQPGDLVFFGSGPSHVGMYIGGGLMIHAPRTGDVVKIVPLSSHGNYVGARRVR